MIPGKYVKAYLAAPKDDHRWMKKLSMKELDAIIAEMDPQPELVPGLRRSQKVCFILGVAYERFSFWLEMGLGKTLITLLLLQYFYQIGKIKKAVVFVNSDKAIPTWEGDIAKFGIKVPYVSLEGSSEAKWSAVRKLKKGLIIVTYPGAVAMCSQKVRKKKGKGGLQINALRVDELCENVNAAVADESTFAGGSSLTNKLIRLVSGRVDAYFNLAGRPFGRDPTILWNQQYLADRGDSLGETLGLFRAAFFSEAKNRFGSEYSKIYTFNKRKTKELTRLMQHRSIGYETKEVLDMPKRMIIVDQIKFPSDSREHYKRAAQELLKARGDFQETKNLFLKMRQITSGFIGFQDDESGEKVKMAFDHNPKLERLFEHIDELRENRKAVIFYEFTWSAQQIQLELKKRKLNNVWFWSGTKDSRKARSSFLNDPKCKIALVQNKVGAYAMDGLQVANYVFIYESPVSVIDREQLERRVFRPGQKYTVHQYDLVIKNSVDERILEFHKEGRNLMKEVRKDPSLLRI